MAGRRAPWLTPACRNGSARAVVADMGASLAVIANGLRLLAVSRQAEGGSPSA